jgi:hypothetical protein
VFKNPPALAVGSTSNNSSNSSFCGIRSVRNRHQRLIKDARSFVFEEKRNLNVLKKFIIAAIGAAAMTFSFVPSTEAAYVTAYQKVIYEKFVVDTTSIYEQDLQHFNCIVYAYESENDSTGKAFVYKFRYDDEIMKWELHTDGTWEVVESNSIAADVLRVCIPYIK